MIYKSCHVNNLFTTFISSTLFTFTSFIFTSFTSFTSLHHFHTVSYSISKPKFFRILTTNFFPNINDKNKHKQHKHKQKNKHR